MKKLLFLIVLTTQIAASCQQTSKGVAPHELNSENKQLTDEDREKLRQAAGKTVKTLTFNQLTARFAADNDTLYIFNFWATWCAPCVEEMPYFEQLADAMEGEKVKIVFVSMDFPDQLKDRVVPFVRENGITSEVVLLDERNIPQTDWINRVSETWEGDIPATLFIRNSEQIREFYAREFTYEQLNAIATNLIW